MWQHEETGTTGFLERSDPSELIQWMRMNRPRKLVCDLVTVDQMLAYAAECVAAEREACAKICERDNDYIGGDFRQSTPQQLAAAIRARSGCATKRSTP